MYFQIMIVAKPFVKWVGGKTQLLDEIRKYYPSQMDKYCEPFVGGGAVLFDVLSCLTPKEVLINDINGELINTYCQIKTNCGDVPMLQECQGHKTPCGPDLREKIRSGEGLGE